VHLSRALAGVAGRIERFSPLGVSEDASTHTRRTEAQA
jgi:hypothetical protein